jgi:hypothetical protein
VPQHGIVIYVTREENVAFHPGSKVYVITTFFLFLEKKKTQNANEIFSKSEQNKQIFRYQRWVL